MVAQQRADRSVRRPQPVVFLRRVARARADQSRQPAHPARPREVRGVRAAVQRRTSASAARTCRRCCGCSPRKGFVHRVEDADGRGSGTGPASRIRPTRSACARSRRTTSSSSTRRAAPTSSARPTSPAARRRCTRKRSTSSKAQLFQVEQLDFEGRKAYVRAGRLRLLHRRHHATPKVDECLRARFAEPIGDAGRCSARRRVARRSARRRRASWASRRSSSTRTRTSARGELDLPEQQMHTTAYWLTMPRTLMASLPFSLRRSARRRRRVWRSRCGRSRSCC